MKRRPLRPVAPLTNEEKRRERRFTWRLLLIGVCTNIVGCGVHWLLTPPRLGGEMARPAPPAVELPLPGKR
jgi:hypothetical protein